MEIRTERLLLRPWKRGDEDALVRHANNRNVWIHLNDRFPHPYRQKDAKRWIAASQKADPPPTELAIVLGTEAIGGLGIRRQTDLSRFSAELGYWLGEAHWGRGYATEALWAMVRYAFSRFDFVRLEARVLEGNPASCRVLEKAGFLREAVLRRGGYKDGRFLDLWLYALLKPMS